MSKPDDDSVILAKVIDFEQARVRREEAARLSEEVEAHQANEQDVERARVEAERMRQMERTARKRRRLQERTAGQRAAASRHRIQVRVADRLARIEAELEAEIARLRLAYAQRRQHAGGGLWMWPTVAAALLALVAGLAYFAGTQQTYATPVAVASPWVASKQVPRQPSESDGPVGRISLGFQRSPSGPTHGGSTSGTSHRSALPVSDPGSGDIPRRSMSPASGITGGTR